MELFKLLGTIAIDNSDANSALKETQGMASKTANSISKSNSSISSSNKSTGSSWSTLKSKVSEYKAQGMTTSAAWRQATADMSATANSASGSIVGAFAKIGAAVAAGLAVDVVLNFGSACIQAAADANAASSQFTQVFGNLEGKASKSLSGIADEAGISENRLKGSFTQIAAFAKTTGMETDDALALSERAMIAVADSAAFYDRSIEDTTESLQSFLKGNYENDAALGLSCTETTRNAAANKLYGKSFNELSEAQKQLTLLQMVEDANKASGALGQAARESDTWTNVTGNLKQAWTDFKAVIGSNFLDAAVQAVKKMVTVVEDWTAKIPALVEWIKNHKVELQALGILLGTVAVAIGAYNLAMNASAIAAGIATTAATAFGAVMAFITSPITLTVAAIGAVVAAIVLLYNKCDWFKAMIDGFAEKLKSAWESIKQGAIALKDKVVQAWDEIKARCEPLVQAIKENLAGAFNDLKEKGQALSEKLSALKEKFQPIADFLKGAFKQAVSEASGKFDEIKGKIGDFAEGALTKLNDGITKVREGFDKFSEFAGRLWDNLDPVVTLIRDNLLNSLQNLKEPIQTIKDAFGTISDTINNSLLPALRDALMPVWESLKSALSGVAGIIGGVFVANLGMAVGAINGIVSAISGFVEAISGIAEIVANVFSLIVGIFTLDGEKCKEAVIGIKDGIVKVFGGLWDAVSGFVKGFVDGVVGFFKGLWDTLVGHSIVPDTIDGIVNCFAGLWDKVKGLIENFKNGVVNAFNNTKNKVISIATNIKDRVSSAFSNLKSKASEIWGNVKNQASEKWNSIKNDVSTKAENIKNKVSTTFNNAKTAAVNAFNNMKSNLSSTAANILSAVTSKFNSMKSKISSVVESAKSKAVSAFSNMKSSISTHLSNAYSTVSEKFNSIKSKITSIMNEAKTAVSTAVSNIKEKFNFSWSLPKPKLPKFNVSGGEAPWGFGGEGSLPSVSISWYKKAMDNAMVLRSPTIFGYSPASGKFLGGGEAGSEVVAGSAVLMDMIQNAMGEQNGAMADRLDSLLDLITRYLPIISMNSEKQIVFDTGAAAGALAPAIDKALGRLSSRKDRGR